MKSVAIIFVTIAISQLMIHSKLEAQAPAQELPAFSFLQQGNKTFSDKNLPPGKMLFFAFVDVDCEHCQQAAKNIVSTKLYLQPVSMYIVSTESVEKTRQFVNKNAPELLNKKNVGILQDRNSQFLSTFKPYRYPGMFLYSADKKLLDYEDNEESVFRFVRTIEKNRPKNNMR